MTKKELYDLAAERNISGRSKMKRDELLEEVQNDMNREGENTHSEYDEAQMDGYSQMTKVSCMILLLNEKFPEGAKMRRDDLQDAIQNNEEQNQ